MIIMALWMILRRQGIIYKRPPMIMVSYPLVPWIGAMAAGFCFDRMQNRLYPEQFQQHGVIQNGILLYGPCGTGQTFLAGTTAGEFKINYWYAKPTNLVERWIGSSEANIRDTFARAYANRPVLFSWTRSIR